MKLEMAPLEGLTTYIFRNTHAKYFGKMDKYYTPFLSLHKEKEFSHKERQEILPENNEGLWVVPQVLTNSAEDFLKAAGKLKALGYEEVNINLGCPSGTVVPKGKGAGMLAESERLEQFLTEVFENTPLKISIKTRLGMTDEAEWSRLLEIYNRFPLEELIVHVRVREDYYKKPVRPEAFAYTMEQSKCPVCYNGDIFSIEDYQKITRLFPYIDSVMIGRGAIKNPAIFREIRQEKKLTHSELLDFAQNLSENYKEVLGSDTYVLHKLKELWVYMIENFPEEKKVKKALHKSTKLFEFENAIKLLK